MPSSRLIHALLAMALSYPLLASVPGSLLTLIRHEKDASRIGLRDWYEGLDIDAVNRALDAVVGSRARLRLGRSFDAHPSAKADHWYRLVEGLYPRLLDQSATAVLEIGPCEACVPLGLYGSGEALSFRGSLTPPPTSPESTVRGADPLGLILGILSLVGWGCIATTALSRAQTLRASPTGMAILLAGALALALLAHIATWLQWPIPFVRKVGWVGLALLPWSRSMLPRESWPGLGKQDWIAAGLLVFALGLSCAGAAITPVTEWDGRVVWLFHAKQLFFSGYLPLNESALLGLQPTYPLLAPALMGIASLGAQHFNERSAAVVVTVFHAAVVLGVFRLARLRYGAVFGAGLAAFAAATGLGWTSQAYADGLLQALLLFAYLALREDCLSLDGWLAIAAAALTKREGLPLGIVVAGFATGQLSGLARAVMATAPAWLHVIWCRAFGLAHELDAPRIPVALFDALERTLLILRKAGGITSRSTVFTIAAAFFVFVIADWIRERRSTEAVSSGFSARLLTGTVLGALFAVYFFTPQPLRWHLETSLPRLALHPTVFAAVAILEAAMRRRDPIQELPQAGLTV